jgi:DNA-binding NarL/FixJ family response regulator
MAARKRTRRDDGTIVTQSVIPQDAKDPNVARLIQVLLMVAQGKTQAQIAAYFDKDVRTIRRWLKRAREMGLAVSSTTTPQRTIPTSFYGALGSFGTSS